MRIVKELSVNDCKVTIYAWNNRYLLKLEQGMLEQTFKISELDVTGDEDIVNVLDKIFLQQANERFLEMGRSFHEALQRSGS